MSAISLYQFYYKENHIYMNINWNLISAFSMAISAFFAGAFLQGERLRTREFKESMEQIRIKQEDIMLRVEEINQYVKVKEYELNSEIDSAYQVLSELNTNRRLSQAKIREIDKKIDIERSKLRLNITKLKEEIQYNRINFKIDQ